MARTTKGTWELFGITYAQRGWMRNGSGEMFRFVVRCVAWARSLVKHQSTRAVWVVVLVALCSFFLAHTSICMPTLSFAGHIHHHEVRTSSKNQVACCLRGSISRPGMMQHHPPSRRHGTGNGCEVWLLESFAKITARAVESRVPRLAMLAHDVPLCAAHMWQCCPGASVQ